MDQRGALRGPHGLPRHKPGSDPAPRPRTRTRTSLSRLPQTAMILQQSFISSLCNKDPQKLWCDIKLVCRLRDGDASALHTGSVMVAFMCIKTWENRRENERNEKMQTWLLLCRELDISHYWHLLAITIHATSVYDCV